MNMPCGNGGECIADIDEAFTCDCPQNYAGRTSEMDESGKMKHMTIYNQCNY